MPHRAPRILTLLLATAGACLAATAASAQSQSQAQPATGRYLTWANRPANTTPADIVRSPTHIEGQTPIRARNDMIPRRVAPSQAPYRPMMQPAPQPLPASRGLTPADAWLGPRVSPAYAPGAPDPVRDVSELGAPVPVERTAPQPQPQPQPIEHAAVDPMPPRRDAPVFSLPRTVSPPMEQAPSPSPLAAADVADPMAPRRDARIFQMQQNEAPGQERAALPAASQAAPSTQASVQSGQSGARYYSVHRDAGHRPDPTPLPEPIYFDSVSMDLAEPPATEVGARDAQGRRRVIANEDPTLP